MELLGTEGVGFFSAAYVASQTQDRVYKYLCEKNGDKGRPEYRLVVTQVGIILYVLFTHAVIGPQLF